jgi:hypothetical protein
MFYLKLTKMKFVLMSLVLMFFASALSAQTAKGKQTLRHVVLFKFKDSSSAADIENVIKEFKALKGSIKQIKALEWGLNNSPEKLNEGLTHAFFLTFANEKDRDDYLVHPVHKKFGDIVGKHIDKVVVVDYWVE